MRLFTAYTAQNDVGQVLRDLAGSLKGVLSDPIRGYGVFYEYARPRANWATGLLAGKHVVLRPQAEAFEDLVRSLPAMADRLVRKYGQETVGKQSAARHLADVMIGLIVLACVISRVTGASMRKGATAPSMSSRSPAPPARPSGGPARTFGNRRERRRAPRARPAHLRPATPGMRCRRSIGR